jgi:TorA maturation chaperone TorD
LGRFVKGGAVFAGTAFLTPEIDKLRPLAPPEMRHYLEEDSKAVQREYTRLFGRDGVFDPPCQSAHLHPLPRRAWPHDSAMSWRRFAGLESEQDHEPADHIGRLLIFWGLFRETEPSPRVLQAFHAEHLSWIPAFCRKLAAEARHPFYRRLAEYTVACVQLADS